jgi:DNA-binding NarL/FixJ family response regulator
MGITRILIADDHDVVRTGLRTILEAQPGWEVVADVSNGREAIDQAVATRPDAANPDRKVMRFPVGLKESRR